MRGGTIKRTLAVLATLGVCTLFSLGLVGAEQPSTVNITLNGLQVKVDAQTGSIVYLHYPATGVLLNSSRASSGLLDLAYPVKAFSPLRLASRFSTARVTKEANGVRISWDALGPSRNNVPLPAGKVSAQVTIRAADDGRSVILSCHIENHSSSPIPQILFPDLWGLKPFDGIKRTELRLAREIIHPFMIPYRKLGTAPPYYSDIGWKEYIAGDKNALRWIDYGSLRGGLSIFQREWGTSVRPDILTYRSEADRSSLRLDWQHKTTIKPGQTWDSGEFWMTPHPGGWAKGIEVFRHYVRQVNPPRKLPPQVRDGLGFQSIWMTQAPETDPSKAYFRFTDLPRVARDARQYDLHELVPWFWCSYFVLPVPLRKDLGTLQEFRDGIQQARRLGVNVAPFFSIRLIRNFQLAKYGVQPAHDNWTYHPELIPRFRPYYTHDLEGTWVDDDNPVWDREALAGFTEWVNRGVTSISFDLFSYKLHPGQEPALIKLVKKVRALARSKDPDSTFSGESGNFEWDGSVLDYNWNWGEYSDAGPIMNVLRTPRLNCDVDHSTLVVKKCFAEDFFLNVMPSKPDLPNGTALISDFPALAASLKEVAHLRQEFLPFFTQGVFIGDSVLSNPTPAFVRAYQLGGRLLILVLNDQPHPTRVVLQSDLALWTPHPESYETKYYDSSGKLVDTQQGQGSSWSGSTPQLQPEGLAVIEIDAR
jgi:hypothetical protein